MQRLGRVVGRKLVYTRVAEFQTRGLIHYHVIVQGIVTERCVRTIVRGGTDLRIIEANKKRGPGTGQRRRNAKVEPVHHGDWTWGAQVDVQHVLPGGKFGVGAYLVKLLGYAVKGTDTSADGPANIGARCRARRCAPASVTLASTVLVAHAWGPIESRSTSTGRLGSSVVVISWHTTAGAFVVTYWPFSANGGRPSRKFATSVRPSLPRGGYPTAT